MPEGIYEKTQRPLWGKLQFEQRRDWIKVKRGEVTNGTNGRRGRKVKCFGKCIHTHTAIGTFGMGEAGRLLPLPFRVFKHRVKFFVNWLINIDSLGH
jgi:hypothetical protein